LIGAQTGWRRRVIDDRAELRRSAARLLDYDFDALLL
jgi:hypothetical protein